jgi:hypothetical protein
MNPITFQFALAEPHTARVAAASSAIHGAAPAESRFIPPCVESLAITYK